MNKLFTTLALGSLAVALILGGTHEAKPQDTGAPTCVAEIDALKDSASRGGHQYLELGDLDRYRKAHSHLYGNSPKPLENAIGILVIRLTTLPDRTVLATLQPDCTVINGHIKTKEHKKLLRFAFGERA